MRAALCFAACLALTGCAGAGVAPSPIASSGTVTTPIAKGPTSAQQTALVTCGAATAAINVLADMRAAGKLSPAQVTVVNSGIIAIDPVCGGSDPNVSLSGLAAAAATELITIAGSK